MQINANILPPDSTAVGDGPGAGRLAGVLEGLMVTVQHKDYGREQLVHPLWAEGEARGRHVARARGRKKN